MMKIAGSGSIYQRHGSADLDPYKNVTICNTGKNFNNFSIRACYSAFWIPFNLAHLDPH